MIHCATKKKLNQVQLDKIEGLGFDAKRESFSQSFQRSYAKLYKVKLLDLTKKNPCAYVFQKTFMIHCTTKKKLNQVQLDKIEGLGFNVKRESFSQSFQSSYAKLYKVKLLNSTKKSYVPMCFKKTS
jgi:hypothetical protein